MKDSWKNKYQQIDIKELNLDIDNPRTNTGVSQKLDNIIEELLDENILELIESISTKGFAAVSITMVVEEKNKKIVIDGNRRLLSVKILNNPDYIKKFVPNIITKNDFEKIKEFSKNKKEEVENLTAIIYPSRQEAEQEMSILHLDGEAVKKWKPLRQYRYFYNRLLQENVNLIGLSESLGIGFDRIRKGLITIQLYNYAKDNIDLGNLNDKVFNDKDFRTDKFQKTVVNEEGERFLKYSFDKEKCILFIEDNKLFKERLMKVLLEIYDDKSNYFSSAQYPTENRSEFFKTIDQSFLNTRDHKNTQSKLKNEIDSGQASFLDNGIESNNIEFKKEKSDEKPKGLFKVSSVPFKLGNGQLQKLYDELKDPNILIYPNATHDLLRSFLECSLISYLKHPNINKFKEMLIEKKKNEGNQTLTNMLDFISKSANSPITDQSIKDLAWQLISDDNSSYSVKRMNMVNHNENWFSDKTQVINTWNKLEPLFKIILNPKK